MASIFSLATRMFRTRDPSRDANTDRDRMLSIRIAIADAITSATRERDGLKRRVEDYYAHASHILDQGGYETRSSADEQEVVEAERNGSAGLRRIAAIDAQLQELHTLLEQLDERREDTAA